MAPKCRKQSCINTFTQMIIINKFKGEHLPAQIFQTNLRFVLIPSQLFVFLPVFSAAQWRLPANRRVYIPTNTQPYSQCTHLCRSDQSDRCRVLLFNLSFIHITNVSELTHTQHLITIRWQLWDYFAMRETDNITNNKNNCSECHQPLLDQRHIKSQIMVTMIQLFT